MPFDPFASTIDTPSSPAEECFAITPDDLQDLPKITKALYIGETGDVAIVPGKGTSAVIFRNVQQGTILDVRTRAVRATGTTADGIVGLA